MFVRMDVQASEAKHHPDYERASTLKYVADNLQG
jgi:hypothetical protein